MLSFVPKGEIAGSEPTTPRVFEYFNSYPGILKVQINDELPTYRNDNHLLAVTYNNVDVLRPLPNLKY